MEYNGSLSRFNETPMNRCRTENTKIVNCHLPFQIKDMLLNHIQINKDCAHFAIILPRELHIWYGWMSVYFDIREQINFISKSKRKQKCSRGNKSQRELLGKIGDVQSMDFTCYLCIQFVFCEWNAVSNNDNQTRTPKGHTQNRYLCININISHSQPGAFAKYYSV